MQLKKGRKLKSGGYIFVDANENEERLPELDRGERTIVSSKRQANCFQPDHDEKLFL